MSRQSINIGFQPNDGNGDTLRVAFEKAEQNFIELYSPVDWTEIQNKPILSNVAITGSYNDLSNKPFIPTTTGLASEFYVENRISELINSAPQTLDTLNELSSALGSDPNFATTVTNSLGNRLRIDINDQNLTTEQKANVLTNISLTGLSVNYVAEDDASYLSLDNYGNTTTFLEVYGTQTDGGLVLLYAGDGNTGGTLIVAGGTGTGYGGGDVIVEGGTGQLFSTAKGGVLYLKGGLNADPQEGWTGRTDVVIEGSTIDLKGITKLQLTNAEPTIKVEGQMLFADGTVWNPGNGKGVYIYYNNMWNLIGPHVEQPKDMCLAYLLNQTLAGSGWNKVPLDVTSGDTNLIFDSINKKIIPKKAGYYTCNAKVMCAGNLLEGLSVYKNGSITVRMGHFVNYSTARAVNGSFTVYCNGTTDYLELFALINGSGYYSGGVTETYLQVFGPL